jgi:hypothetical protein
MAGDRTLTLKILGDTKNLVDSLNKGAKGTESFTKQISDLSAKVVKSFVAIGTAVGAFSVAFAKAAAEDQQAANRLAQTLGAVTNATEKQIAAVGKYITQTSLATGKTDDELRPAFERLARSTESTEKSQTLLNLALDLSAATSAPLEAVTNALAKAYDGNYTALNRLGLGIDQNLIKSKDFDSIYKSLNATFGEFSERRSEEALVKFQRLQVALQEAKEAVGAALLPAFERLGDWLLNSGVPRLNAFIAGLVGDRSLSSSFTAAQKEAEQFGEKVRSVIETIVKYKDELIAVSVVAAGIFTVTKIAAGVQATILLIQGLVKAYNTLRVSAMAAGIATAFALNPALGIAAGTAAIAGMGLLIQQLNKQSDAIGGVDVGGALGNFQMSTGTVLGAAGGGFAGGGGGGGGVSSFGAGGGGGGGRSLADLSGGLVTSPQDLISRLQSTSSRISDIQFALDTGQISKSKAAELLRPIQKEFNMLQRVGESLQTASIPMNTTSAEEARFNRAITINVNAPSVIDETGFTRAVVDALNSVERRQAGGYSALLR